MSPMVFEVVKASAVLSVEKVFEAPQPAGSLPILARDPTALFAKV